MSEMEPDIKNFLSKVLSSLFDKPALVAYKFNDGIGFNYAFFENKPSVGKLYFLCLVFSKPCFPGYVSYRKKWKF